MTRRRDPSAIGSVMDAMPFLRTADPDTNMVRAVQLVGYLSTAHEAAQRYRANVLAQPDLTERIAQLFRYQRPQSWNGYVPPRIDSLDAYNTSPYRARLVEIVTEALTRSGDWRGYDSDRLATVPERHIRAPWTEVGG